MFIIYAILLNYATPPWVSRRAFSIRFLSTFAILLLFFFFIFLLTITTFTHNINWWCHSMCNQNTRARAKVYPLLRPGRSSCPRIRTSSDLGSPRLSARNTHTNHFLLSAHMGGRGATSCGIYTAARAENSRVIFIYTYILFSRFLVPPRIRKRNEHNISALLMQAK